MGLILAIDPGPTTCGVVLYDADAKRVCGVAADATIEDTLGRIRSTGSNTLVAIERVQSAGISGASLLQTSEVVGRLQQRALDCGLRVRLVYRREVCSALHVSGGAKDAQVRQRMIEMHPGGTGTRKTPGPLYGVSSHAWQALGLAVAVTLLPQDTEQT
jgi:hypothetical protein